MSRLWFRVGTASSSKLGLTSIIATLCKVKLNRCRANRTAQANGQRLSYLENSGNSRPLAARVSHGRARSRWFSRFYSSRRGGGLRSRGRPGSRVACRGRGSRSGCGRGSGGNRASRPLAGRSWGCGRRYGGTHAGRRLVNRGRRRSWGCGRGEGSNRRRSLLLHGHEEVRLVGAPPVADPEVDRAGAAPPEQLAQLRLVAAGEKADRPEIVAVRAELPRPVEHPDRRACVVLQD